jgi:hypothetical protein
MFYIIGKFTLFDLTWLKNQKKRFEYGHTRPIQWDLFLSKPSVKSTDPVNAPLISPKV